MNAKVNSDSFKDSRRITKKIVTSDKLDYRAPLNNRSVSSLLPGSRKIDLNLVTMRVKMSSLIMEKEKLEIINCNTA